MINIENLKPFPKFCCSIGMIPTAYKVSLTYEEQLLWLCDFLENTVIPTVNNNGQAVEELQNLFVTLTNYVDNYFDNLDVQEEINNKLDEMAENGTLQTIMLNYISVSKVYNTLQDVLSDNLITNNQKIKTLGYYNKNDGGNGEYFVRQKTNEDVENGGNLIFLNNNLVCELIIKNSINIKQFGGKGDGETDETIVLQNFLNCNAPKHIINDGNYLIDDDLIINSNTNLIFLNAKITRKPTNKGLYYMFDLYQVHDVNIINAHLIGDKDNHLDTSGSEGNCINIAECYNINIKDCLFEKAWGDGIYLGYKWSIEPTITTSNITIDNCKLLNNSRNGISITSGNNITVKNSYIYGTTRINPKTGIDIEPEHSISTVPHLTNIVIDNVSTDSNIIGLGLPLKTYDINVMIKNCNSNNEAQGVVCFSALGSSQVDIINHTCKNVNNSGMNIQAIGQNSKVNIVNPTFIDYAGSSNDISLSNAIKLDATDYDIYNVSIENMNVLSQNNKRFLTSLYASASGASTYKIYNLKVDNIYCDYANTYPICRKCS